MRIFFFRVFRGGGGGGGGGEMKRVISDQTFHKVCIQYMHVTLTSNYIPKV